METMDWQEIIDGLRTAEWPENIHWPETDEERRAWLRQSCPEGCEFFHPEIEQDKLSDADLLEVMAQIRSATTVPNGYLIPPHPKDPSEPLFDPPEGEYFGWAELSVGDKIWAFWVVPTELPERFAA